MTTRATKDTWTDISNTIRTGEEKMGDE